MAKGAVACKVSSTNQDWRLDVPTVGLETVKTAVESGISVLVLEAHRVFLLDREECISLADANGMAIYGYTER